MRIDSALLFTLSLLCTGLAHAALGTAVTRPALLVKESVDGAGAVQVTGKVGGLGFTEDGFGLAASASSVPETQLPSITPPTLTGTREEVSATATSWVTSNITALNSTLDAYMKQYGLSSVWFLYEQRVTITASSGTGPTQQVMSWSMFQDAKGRSSYGVPRFDPLNSADVRVLQVAYAAKAVPSGLPGTYANVNGGKMYWQVLNSSLAPVGAVNTWDVNGGFDPPSGMLSNDQAVIRCLVSAANVGCSNLGNDVKRLMGMTGATLALVDYTYSPEPQYTKVNDSLCPTGTGPAGTCFAAVGSYNFTQREMKYEYCGDIATYVNAGTYSFNVESITDRFLIDPQTLDSNPIQRITRSVGSQTQSFNPPPLSLTPSQAAGITGANLSVINPFDGTSLINASVLGPNVSLVDVQRTGEISCAPVSATVSPAAHNVATTGSFTVTPAGGKPPYSYRWALVVDYANGSISIGNSTGQTTTIARSGPTMGQAGGTVAYVDVIVTDARGSTGSARVSLTINPDPPPLVMDLESGFVSQPSYTGNPAIVGSCSAEVVGCYAATGQSPYVVSGGTGSYVSTWTHLSNDSATVNQPWSYRTTFSRQQSAGAWPVGVNTPLASMLYGVYRLSVNDGVSTVSSDLEVQTYHVRNPPSCAAAAGAVSLSNYSMTATGEGYVSGVFVLRPDGTIFGDTGSTHARVTQINTAWRSGGSSSNWEVRFTMIQGEAYIHNSLPNPALDQWLSLDNQITLVTSITGNGGLGYVWGYRLEIRDKCSGAIVATGTARIDLNIPWSNG